MIKRRAGAQSLFSMPGVHEVLSLISNTEQIKINKQITTPSQ